MTDDFVFALDIGTRSIVGIILKKNDSNLEVVAFDRLEHRTRAMVDGQIHDVEQVVEAIKTIKEKLEIKTGLTLTQVAVAAAGRALRTVRMKAESELGEYREIHKDDILALELEAVQKAQGNLFLSAQEEPNDSTKYHCVGYSVVNYELDGYKIGNLYGQKGNHMTVEVIATFLPRLVVDSLQTSVEKAGLTMMSLTLEPIAASAVVVPSGMRHLNIALVDVGAGTSDIAITDGGSITGYGMVPLAGDEVTEKISQHCLVDFNEAERLKRLINDSEEITFTDILGIEHRITKEEILDALSDTVDSLAKSIAEKILEINGRAPQAVICIGGGSLTPLLKEKTADHLGLPKQRVAVRGREAIKEVLGAQELVGPEAVTPIGIGVTAYERKGLGFIRVTVNNYEVRLFEIQRSTVADALLAAGMDMAKTRPRLGMALTITVNGELKIIKGGKGKAAVIRLNGSDVTIDTPVKHNDVIEFVEAEDGQNATGFVYDVVPELQPMNISVNHKPVTVNPVITMNDQPVSYYDELVDNARIEYHFPKTLAEILDFLGYSGVEGEYQVYVNERIVDPTTVIREGDKILLEKIHSQDEAGAQNQFPEDVTETTDTTETAETTGTTETTGASELYIQSTLETAAAVEDVPPGKTVVIVNNEKVEVPRSDIILTDLLTRINFSLQPPVPNSKLEMKVNGVPAEFTTPLKNGDNVTFEWKT